MQPNYLKEYWDSKISFDKVRKGTFVAQTLSSCVHAQTLERHVTSTMTTAVDSSLTQDMAVNSVPSGCALTSVPEAGSVAAAPKQAKEIRLTHHNTKGFTSNNEVT